MLPLFGCCGLRSETPLFRKGVRGGNRALRYSISDLAGQGSDGYGVRRGRGSGDVHRGGGAGIDEQEGRGVDFFMPAMAGKQYRAGADSLKLHKASP